MTILLDERNPQAPAHSFLDAWNVHSTYRMRWQGKENGKLLRRATGRRFDALITPDRNMQHEQNPNTPLPFVVLQTHSLRAGDLQAIAVGV